MNVQFNWNIAHTKEETVIKALKCFSSAPTRCNDKVRGVDNFGNSWFSIYRLHNDTLIVV